MIQAMGGIEQVRVFHHTFAVILILVSIAHAVQLGYRVYVQRTPLSMLPTLKDVTDFVDSLKYNLGLSEEGSCLSHASTSWRSWSIGRWFGAPS